MQVEGKAVANTNNHDFQFFKAQNLSAKFAGTGGSKIIYYLKIK